MDTTLREQRVCVTSETASLSKCVGEGEKMACYTNALLSFQLDFEDSFKEHKGTKTIPALYKVLGLIFKYTKLVLYHIFVILVGIPLIILWAIINGITAFVLVWMWGPALRYLIVWVHAIVPAVMIPVTALLTPYVDVMARFLSKIKVTANVNGSLGKKLAGQEHLV
jgi:hypothetical protein